MATETNPFSRIETLLKALAGTHSGEPVTPDEPTEPKSVEAQALRVAGRPKVDDTTLALQHFEVATLLETHAARFDLALDHYKKAFRLDPSQQKALVRARELCISLEDFNGAAQIYQLEITRAAENAERARLLLALGRLRADKLDDIRGALIALDEAVSLQPTDRPILEALAEVLSHPDCEDEGALERAATLFLALGQNCITEGNYDQGIVYLRRALGANPADPAAYGLLAEAYERTSQWAALDRLYAQRQSILSGDALATVLLARAKLADVHRNERAEAKQLYESALPILLPDDEATARLIKLLEEDGQHDDVLRIRQTFAAREVRPDVKRRLQLDIAKRLLSSKEADEASAKSTLGKVGAKRSDTTNAANEAAAYLRILLTDNPLDTEALSLYLAHLRSRNDHRRVAAQIDAYVEAATAALAQDPASEATPEPTTGTIAKINPEQMTLLGQLLEELADLAEKRLGDLPRALAAWERLGSFPGFPAPRVQEARRRISAKTQMWTGLISLLEKERQEAPTPQARAEVSRRMAQIHRERHMFLDRAIALYEEVLAEEPSDSISLRALGELYERQGDAENQARILERLFGTGLPKVEELNLLRKLGRLYGEVLRSDEQALDVYRRILERVPGDRESLERAEELLEKGGRFDLLVDMLSSHLSVAATPAEKTKLLRRLAQIEGRVLGHANEAAGHYEALRKLSPDDEEAQTALIDHYANEGRESDRLALLERRVVRLPVASPAAATARRELCRALESSGADAHRSLTAWQKLLELLPHDVEAAEAVVRVASKLAAKSDSEAHHNLVLSTLERLESNGKDPATKSGWAIEQARLLLAAADATAKNVSAAAKRAANEARSQAMRQKARATLERICALPELAVTPDGASEGTSVAAGDEISGAAGTAVGGVVGDTASGRAVLAPGQLRQALMLLQPLVIEAKEDLSAVFVAERLFRLTDDQTQRLELALDIARRWDGSLGEPAMAVLAYERVLLLDPKCDEASLALARIFLATKDRPRYLHVMEQRIARTEAPEQRGRLCIEVAEAAVGPFEDVELGFAWTSRACREHLTKSSLDALVEFIAKNDVPQPSRAVALLHSLIDRDPEGRLLLEPIEKLSERTGETDHLLSTYKKLLGARSDVEEQLDLRLRQAKVLEGRGDIGGAMDAMQSAFALGPDVQTIRSELFRLAEKTGRFEDLLHTEAVRFSRTTDPETRIELAKGAAAIAEEKLGDRVRAFRAYLRAMTLAPDEASPHHAVIEKHLWRLARDISSAPAQEAEKAKSSPVPPDDSVATPTPSAIVAGGESSVTMLVSEEISEISLNVSETIELSDDEVVMVDDSEDSITAVGKRSADTSTKAKLPPTTKPPVPGSAPRMNAPGIIPASLSGKPSPINVWQELAHAYETAVAATAPASPERDVRALTQAARVWIEGPADFGHACALYERAFAAVPGDKVVLEKMAAIGKTHGAWNELFALFDRLTHRGSSAAVVRDLHLACGHLALDAGDEARAERSFRQALQIEPTSADAWEQLRALLTSQARHAELTQLFEEELSVLSPGADSIARRIALLFLLADLYEKSIGKPYEAIETLLRLEKLAPEEADVFMHQARLYRSLGMLAKAAEALVKEAQYSPPERNRPVRLALAELYQSGLDIPARAAEVYANLAEEYPDDVMLLEPLDVLYGRLGQADARARVLGRRAQLEEGLKRLATMRTQAEVYEEPLGDFSRAEQTWRQILELAPDDASARAKLRACLLASGRPEQSAERFEEDIAYLAPTLTPEPLAELYLELANLYSGVLGNSEKARAAVEAALEQVPGHGAALTMLGHLTAGSTDHRGYAQARVREAKATTNVGQSQGALREAARVYERDIHDPAAAEPIYRDLLEIDSTDQLALRGMARLAEQRGDYAAAKSWAEKWSDVAAHGPERAAALVTFVRTLRLSHAPVSSLRHLLDEALKLQKEIAPHPSGASAGLPTERIEGLAEGVIEKGEIDWLEGHIEDAAAAFESAAAMRSDSPLARGHALERAVDAHERLGKLDEGYRKLLELDRKAPGDLFIRMAMGENRFRARRWREAGSHFVFAAEHKLGGVHPRVAARALSRLGEAEHKMRHMDRSRGYFEAALERDPTSAAALSGLRDLAEERGDMRMAAEMRRRAALLGGDPATLEAAADTQASLGGTSEALELYREAGRRLSVAPTTQNGNHSNGGAAHTAEADPASARVQRARLLGKWLPLERDHGAIETSQSIAAELVDLADDATARSHARRVFAAIAFARGETERALEAWWKTLEDNPSDETALLAVAEHGDPGKALGVLTRTLGTMPAPTTSDAASRRGALYERLAVLRRDVTRDLHGAVSALERALAFDPDRLSARKVLADLYDAMPNQDVAGGPTEQAMQNHLAILALSPLEARSLSALSTSLEAQGSTRKVAVAALGQVLRLAEPAQAEAGAKPVAGVVDQGPYPGVLSDEDHAAFGHPDARVWAEAFSAVFEAMGVPEGTTLAQYGVEAANRLSPVADHRVARIFGQVGRSLGNKRAGLYLAKLERPDDLTVVAQAPTSILADDRLAEGTPDRPAPSTATLRFLLGKTIELARPEYIFAVACPPRVFASLFSALLRNFHPRHTKRPSTESDPSAALAAQVRKVIPYSITKRLVSLFAEQAGRPWSTVRWRDAVVMTANRAGLLACGDLEAALMRVAHDLGVELVLPDEREKLPDLLRKQPLLRDLLVFATSPTYLSLRTKLLGQ